MGRHSGRGSRPASQGSHLPRTGLKPLRQGELDGLCGLYAGINALRLLFGKDHPLARREVKDLFEAGVAHLAEYSNLPAAIVGGFEAETWDGLLAVLVAKVTDLTGQTVRVTRPLQHVRHPSRTCVFNAIEVAITSMNPVLIELSGVHQHFTVVCGYSASRLVLFDSGVLYWLTCRLCVVRGGGNSMRHIINPRSLTILALHHK